MKKFFILCAILMMSIDIHATGKFHAIIFADTNDDRLGDGFEANVSMMLDELGVITAALDMESSLELHVYDQFECNSAKLKEVIKNFRCGPDDIVTFFYFGHGTRSANDKSDFPQMCLGERNQNNFIPLEDVLNALRKKGPRLTIVYGDCCNGVDSPNTTPKFGVLSAAGSSTISSTQKKAIRHLFFDNKGSLMISGCRKNEFSLYFNSKSGGGVLTISFIGILEEYTNRSSNPSWEELMTGVREVAFDMSSEIHKRRPDLNPQHPQWLNKLNGISPVTPPTPPTSVKPANLLAALIDIANEKNSISYRINHRQSLINEYFTSNAVVEVVGRNGTTSLSEESASDFISRISTAFRLKNFVIHEKKTGNNG